MDISEWIEKLVGNVDNCVFLECGAHWGDDTQKNIKLLSGLKAYYAFEPDPRNIKIFRETVLDPRVELIETAVGEKEGRAKFYLSSGKPAHERQNPAYNHTHSNSLLRPTTHLSAHPWCKFDKIIEVRVQPLDTFCKTKDIGKINFIWADIQGAEGLMIKGAQSVLSRTDYLYMECAPVPLYDGAMSFNDLIALLPGKWEILERFSNDVLLKRIESPSQPFLITSSSKLIPATLIDSPLNADLSFDRPVTIFFNHLRHKPLAGTFNVFVACMEPEVFRSSNAAIINSHRKYDLILASDEAILNACPNARKMPYGTSWVSNCNVSLNKKFCVSFLINSKRITAGHIMRHNLWRRQREIYIPKQFWASRDYKSPVNIHTPRLDRKPSDKIKMFSGCQFHIAIENTSSKNYFTEKIVDCFITKTVPIYYGCPNIGEYFDPSGIIMVNSVDDIIRKCRTLNNTTYGKMLNVVNKNFETAKQYVSFTDRLQNMINEALTDSTVSTVLS